MQLRQDALDDELKKILEYTSSFEDELAQVRKDFNIEGNAVFDAIDDMALGYISSHMLVKFLREQCGYKLQNKEVDLVLARYDKDHDYRISREEFLGQVCGDAGEKEDSA